MRAHDAMKSEEANDAAWEAARGGVAGAVKWGIGAAILGAAGYLQMCGMVPGAMIEADSRLRAYEQRVRMQRRLMGDRAKWERYEEEYIKGDGK
ncbi:imidazoleglycerol-phosphate dehydratase [Fusarium longipes]|uniref:Imidazoleglycerol-phosphate dehydratase n=1 Tax=Fusarium longipes TaxID=694270 RepID=A0A395T1B2_9HYPO|nr:imidazoleglycerol-phosphate dehydratase [Fusarium longipes]